MSKKLPSGRKNTAKEYNPAYREDRWLSLLEACYYTQLSKETLYRRIYEENIPYHRVGKLYRFKTAELDNWIMKQTT